MGAKPYDGSGDPEAAWLWLDRVNKVYGVMGCTDEQRVLFSSFLMEDKAKDWWDAVEMRYPDAYHGTNSTKSLLIGSFLRAIKIQKLRSSSDWNKRTCQYQNTRRSSHN